jgi:hypothetical protein
MAFEARVACGALALGLALLTIALFEGCFGGDGAGASRSHRQSEPSGAAGVATDRKPFPRCPDRPRSQPLSHAVILGGGHAVRAFYASSSDHRPCGFAFGENGRALVVLLQTADPAIVRADLRPRCVDLVLPTPVDEDLDLLLVPSRDAGEPVEVDAALQDKLIANGRCRGVRPPANATIDID